MCFCVCVFLCACGVCVISCGLFAVATPVFILLSARALRQKRTFLSLRTPSHTLTDALEGTQLKSDVLCLKLKRKHFTIIKRDHVETA